MARQSAQERIESLVRRPADFPFDGYIVEIYPGFVTMRMVGSNKIKRGVAIPSHIDPAELTKGMPARLLDHENQPVLVEVFKNFSELPNYAGKGSVIPNPPRLGVVAAANGWIVVWAAVSGADKYRLYRNDAPNPNSPDDLGIVFNTIITVPYEGNYRWFAAKAISGLQESELSGWVTDSDPPATPNTFAAEDAFLSHRLIISVTDVSLRHYGFKYWEVETADSALGQNNTSLGYLGPSDFPKIIDKAAGAVNWYRIRAFDYADNASAWSAWDQATALALSVPPGQEIEDRFDGYGGKNFSLIDSLYWLQIGTGMEPFDTPGYNGEFYWSTALSDVVRVSENDAIYGNGAVRARANGVELRLILSKSPDGISDGIMNLEEESRFTDNDYFTFYLYVSQGLIDEAPNTFTISFYAPFIPAVAVHIFDLGDFVVGYNKIFIKKSDFQTSPGFSWSQVYQIYFAVDETIAADTSVWFAIDDVRFVKADPAYPDRGNDTGGVWQFTGSNEADAGVWHVFPGDAPGETLRPYSLGQIDNSGSGKHLLAYRDGNIDTGMVQAGVYFKDSLADGGIAFFISSTTPSAWTFYVIRAQALWDRIQLEKWIDGVATVLGTAPMVINRDQIIWLGVDLREFASDAGRIKVYASKKEGNIIQASNLVISIQDASLPAGGGVGLVCRDRNTRFINFLAGSPAHAIVSDVAFALDGPIIAGQKRVRFNPTINWFEYSDDGETWTNLAPPA